jgi:hypothetical protein
MSNKWIATALGCLLLIDALLTSSAGFIFGFTEDDLMNAHWALTRSWLQLAFDTLKFWTVSPVYRPAGAIFLKIIYSLGGMNLFEWRCFYGALFCTAILLAFATAWRLTNRLPVACIASLLMSFHAAFRWLYFGMGFIYDVTALIFCCGFLLVWLRTRENSSDWLVALASGVFILGLQCKEIALDAIVFAFLYELIFDPPRSINGLTTWITRRPLLPICACVGIVFAVSRLGGQNALTQFSQYRLSLSPTVYLSHMAAWMRQIYTEPITLRAAWAVAPWLIAAFWSSWRLALWSLLSFCGGVLPVAFIEMRGAQDLFVPSLPLSILAALAFTGVCEAIARVFLRSGTARETAKAVLVGIVCLLIIIRQGTVKDRQGSFALSPMDRVVGEAVEAARNLNPRPDRDGRIVVDSDPFDSQWEDLSLFRLAFNAPQLQVKRPSQLSGEERQADELGQWRHIGWNGSQWVNLGYRKH